MPGPWLEIGGMRGGDLFRGRVGDVVTVHEQWHSIPCFLTTRVRAAVSTVLPWHKPGGSGVAPGVAIDVAPTIAILVRLRTGIDA